MSDSVLNMLPNKKHFTECYERWLAAGPGFQANQLNDSRKQLLFLKSYLACHPVPQAK